MAGIVNQPALADLARPQRGVGGVSTFGRSLIDDLDAATALTTLGIANHDSISITSSGEATNAEQPCFLAYNSVTDSSVTGNGATVTVDFDTEVIDQGANFTTDTFTAPVTGRYLLSTNVRYIGATKGTVDSAVLLIVTSNRSYRAGSLDTDDLAADEIITLTVVADMDASDTVTVTLQVNGEASDLVDIHGDSTLRTSFSGCLLA